MVELRICKRDNEVSRYSFDSGSVIIGRGAENEVHLNSPSVSPQHARLSLTEGTCSIQNLAAKGGTFVNNLEIKRAQLYDKDVVRIGNYTIAFSIDSAAKLDTSPQSSGSTAPESTREAGVKHIPTTELNFESAERDGAADTPFVTSKGSGGPPQTSTSATKRQDNTAPGQAKDADGSGGHSALSDRLIDADAALEESAQVEKDETLEPAATNSSLSPLHGAGIDVLAGPAQGKRVYFTRDRAALGIKDVTAVVIKSIPDGYIAQAPNKDIVVTLNGNVIAESSVPLDSGDLIAFGNLKARFFVED